MLHEGINRLPNFKRFNSLICTENIVLDDIKDERLKISGQIHIMRKFKFISSLFSVDSEPYNINLQALQDSEKIVVLNTWIDATTNKVKKSKSSYKKDITNFEECGDEVKDLINSVLNFYIFQNEYYESKENKILHTVFTTIDAIKNTINIKINSLEKDVTSPIKKFFYNERMQHKLKALKELKNFFNSDSCDDYEKYLSCLKGIKKTFSQLVKGVVSDVENILYGIEIYYQVQERKKELAEQLRNGNPKGSGNPQYEVEMNEFEGPGV